MTETKNEEKNRERKMLQIDFIDSELAQFSESLKQQIQMVLEYCLKTEDISGNLEVTIAYISPEEIHILNRDYRNTDRTTDVLSFPIFENVEEIRKQREELPILLGDIYINPVRAKDQAAEIGNTYDYEVTFLSLHSFLHLLGYDHMIDEDKEEMRAQERLIMSILKDHEK